MPSKSREKEIFNITIIGTVCNALLLTFKFIAGFVGNSSAMVADAVHSLSDFVTDLIVLIFIRISGKPQDHDHDYGHGKFETLATALIGFMLFAVGLWICWEGGKKIWDVAHGVVLNQPGKIALWAALISILIKEVLYQWTVRVGKSVGSQAVMANAWHHRSDAFSSVATAIGIGGAIFLGEKWRVLDPLTAVAVSVFIIIVAIRFIKKSLDELLEKSLPPETEQEILDIIALFPEAHDPHNLRTRRIGNDVAIEVHIRFNKNLSVASAHQTATEIEMKLREKFGQHTHIVTHIEPQK